MAGLGAQVPVELGGQAVQPVAAGHEIDPGRGVGLALGQGDLAGEQQLAAADGRHPRQQPLLRPGPGLPGLAADHAQAGGNPLDAVHRVPAPGDVHPEHLAAAEAEAGNAGHHHGGRIMPGVPPAALTQPQPVTQPVALRDPLGGLPPGEVQHLAHPPGQREDDLQAIHHIRLAAGVGHRVPDPDGAARDGLGLRDQAQAGAAVFGLDAGAPLPVLRRGGPEERRPVAPGGGMAAAGVQPVTGQAGPAEPARAVLGQQRAGPDRRQQRGHLAGLQPARGHRAGPRRGQRPRLREQDQPGTGR